MTARRGFRRLLAAFRRKAVFELPAPDSVGLSPEPAFGPSEPFFSHHFNAVPDNGFSRQLDTDITAYQRKDAAELRLWLTVDTAQPNPYYVDRPGFGHIELDAAGKEAEASTTAHPTSYVPQHAAREDEETADLGNAVVGFLDAWHRPWLRQYAEARTAPLFGGAA